MGQIALKWVSKIVCGWLPKMWQRIHIIVKWFKNIRVWYTATYVWLLWVCASIVYFGMGRYYPQHQQFANSVRIWGAVYCTNAIKRCFKDPILFYNGVVPTIIDTVFCIFGCALHALHKGANRFYQQWYCMLKRVCPIDIFLYMIHAHNIAHTVVCISICTSYPQSYP